MPGVQAVLTNRADVNVAAVQVAKYAASRQARLESKVSLADGNRFGFALRKESAAFRAEVDRQLECMKQDGTLGRIYEKWFSEAPPADSSTAKTYPGAGMPGLEGYDANGSKAACG